MTKQLEQTIKDVEELPAGDLKYIEQGTGYKEMTEPYVTTDHLKALAAEVKRLNHTLETIRNMSVYIHEKDPNPDPQFMADFYKTKLADALDHARKILEGE